LKEPTPYPEKVSAPFSGVFKLNIKNDKNLNEKERQHENYS
jgi:hypothetical protein